MIFLNHKTMFFAVFFTFFITIILTSLLRTQCHRVVVSGSTGYIGRNVVKELVSRGIPTAALIRRGTVIPERTQEYLKGAEQIFCDVSNLSDTFEAYEKFLPSATICCLASRSGVRKDAWAVDYESSLNTLKAFVDCRKDLLIDPMGHFVLLSAYCCGKPELQFQHAKLMMEEDIKRAPVSHSIVRPTAFFKSLDGQIESARAGNPILLFGNGSCSANAISEPDLARFLVDCALDSNAVQMTNATRSIGGPDVPPLTKNEQAALIFDTLKIPKKDQRIVYLPVALFDVFIGAFSTAANLLRRLDVLPLLRERAEDAAELSRIVRYYAVEPMVATDPLEVTGTVRLRDHFRRVAARGGVLEEIDPMTTTAGVLGVFANNTYYRRPT